MGHGKARKNNQQSKKLGMNRQITWNEKIDAKHKK